MKLSAPIYQLKRRARMLARVRKIPLHQALDSIAREEGFATWSLLSAQFAASVRSESLLPRLRNGDLLLLAARPGQGKTMLGLQLLRAASREGRRAVFFTLEYTANEARERLHALDGDTDGVDDRIEVIASDDVGADFITRYLAGASRGTIAIIDYLQILDQQRNKPPLAEQMSDLGAFARRSGIILGFISQIDRSFDPNSKPLPDIQDVRMPNPFDPGVFSKTCFLHNGEVRFQSVA